ncbi:MAG: toxin-antitoxin system HicB family antitoxin [Terriglobus sp.]
MQQQIVRKQSFPLRLSDSMKREATRLANEEQISLNHFIALAVAEKLSRMEQTQISQYKQVPVHTLGSPQAAQIRRAV